MFDTMTMTKVLGAACGSLLVFLLGAWGAELIYHGAGGHGDEVSRTAFVSGDAITVLPYDPVSDRVLLVEQFRAGPYARGDSQPWLLEALAGRIDGGESPEEAVLREAQHIPAAEYYAEKLQLAKARLAGLEG